MTDEHDTSGAAAKGGTDLRNTVRVALADGRVHEAMQAAQALLAGAPGRATHRFLRDLVENQASASPDLKRLKVALLSSFSSEFLHDSLMALGLASGLAIDVYQAAFGTFRQALLDADSDLYAWAPDVVVLAVEAEDWVPAACDQYLASTDGLEAIPAQLEQDLRSLADALRARSGATLLIHNLAYPAWPALGIQDGKAQWGQAALAAALNARIGAVAREVPDVHVVDYAALVNRHGALNWYDARMKLYARAPIASAMQHHLSAEYVKFLRGMRGLAKKCIVVDLDNTLWGGIVGEDGIDGIRLGPNYPGNAFVAFQKALLDLHRRGVILAVASKNNPADVEEVFANHRFMVLRKEHFADLEIHWESKRLSLARLAERLSIGLEHIVFFDDNPVECEEVRRGLPMVQVVQLPAQPERYVAALQEPGWFETASASAEDRRRGELYRQRAQAEAARSRMTSVEDYYRDLAMEIEIRPVDEASLPRTAQLTQKTNQFNVATIRYTEADVAKRMSEPDWILATTTVRDRFGDNGIVGVAMARHAGSTVEIDTLLMSCRVIGRTVETAMLAHLCDEARRRGARSLVGRVVPTAKNAPAQDLFERHGFERLEADGATGSRWRLDLASASVAWPEWFRRTPDPIPPNSRTV